MLRRVVAGGFCIHTPFGAKWSPGTHIAATLFSPERYSLTLTQVPFLMCCRYHDFFASPPSPTTSLPPESLSRPLVVPVPIAKSTHMVCVGLRRDKSQEVYVLGLLGVSYKSNPGFAQKAPVWTPERLTGSGIVLVDLIKHVLDFSPALDHPATHLSWLISFAAECDQDALLAPTAFACRCTLWFSCGTVKYLEIGWTLASARGRPFP